jgi:hypothetical protein
VGLSFGAGLTAGVAGSTVYGGPPSDPAATRLRQWVKGYQLRFGLDARQTQLLWAVLEKFDEEERDLLDREVMPDLLQDRRDAIGKKTNQRIYKILDPRQRAVYDRSQTLAGARAR